jgi:putative FmdB family regulatory protein
MPTYDYRCAKCGQDIEVHQSFSEKPLTKHAECGGKLQKVLSPAGIVLKGSGFYKTDNRSSSKAASREKESTKDTKDTKSGNGDSSSNSGAAKDSGSSSSSGSSGKEPSRASSNGSSSKGSEAKSA